MKELEIKINKSIKIKIDNKSTINLAINLAKNPVFYGRSKHIKTEFYFSEKQVNRGRLNVSHYYAISHVKRVYQRVETGEYLNLRNELGVFENK